MLAVAGLLLGLVIERGPPHSAQATFLRARGAVLSTLRSARLDAMTRGEAVSVRFDAAQRALVETSGARVLRRAVLPEGAAVLTPAGAIAGAMIFRPDGTGSAAGWRLASGARNLTVTLSPLTGRVLADGP